MHGNYLIAGASSGIGEACVRRLAGEGTTLIIVARREDRLQKLKQECPGNIIPVVYDLNDIYNIKQIFDVCSREKIKLDGMVYSAGMDGLWPLKTNNTQAMQQIMNVNCFAFVEAARNFYSARISNEGAAIVAISSIASLLSETGMSAYSASKAAMNSYVKTMSKEFLRRKIRVNAILPAGVATEMAMKKGALLQGMEEVNAGEGSEPKKLNSLGIISPENIAENVEFLLSDTAKHMTGELMTIGSGMSY